MVGGPIDEGSPDILPGIRVGDPSEVRANLAQPRRTDRTRAWQPEQAAVEQRAKLSGLVEEVAFGTVQLRKLADASGQGIVQLHVDIATDHHELFEIRAHPCRWLRLTLTRRACEHAIGHAADIRESPPGLFGLQPLEPCVHDRLFAIPDAPLEPRRGGKLRPHGAQELAELDARAADLEHLLRRRLAVAQACEVRLDFGERRLAVLEQSDRAGLPLPQGLRSL